MPRDDARRLSPEVRKALRVWAVKAVSLGMSHFAKPLPTSGQVGRADRAMYQAKQDGKNRVFAAQLTHFQGKRCCPRGFRRNDSYKPHVQDCNKKNRKAPIYFLPRPKVSPGSTVTRHSDLHKSDHED